LNLVDPVTPVTADNRSDTTRYSDSALEPHRYGSAI